MSSGGINNRKISAKYNWIQYSVKMNRFECHNRRLNFKRCWFHLSFNENCGFFLSANKCSFISMYTVQPFTSSTADSLCPWTWLLLILAQFSAHVPLARVHLKIECLQIDLLIQQNKSYQIVAFILFFSSIKCINLAHLNKINIIWFVEWWWAAREATHNLVNVNQFCVNCGCALEISFIISTRTII